MEEISPDLLITSLQIASKALITVGMVITLGLTSWFSNSNMSQSSQIDTKRLAKPYVGIKIYVDAKSV